MVVAPPQRFPEWMGVLKKMIAKESDSVSVEKAGQNLLHRGPDNVCLLGVSYESRDYRAQSQTKVGAREAAVGDMAQRGSEVSLRMEAPARNEMTIKQNYFDLYVVFLYISLYRVI
ncbi:hypothetical protein KIN20_031216 [Parelaphostrongylus tenuis]|uniref:Uncharacterized protein n=1 Tax=Parelaphostrongylus tenuis TaxID=148309 RepID=A0AAD5R4U7_PARTN|nr:hypothetical protein KIN20_031216 [Parelaphostrongylus tenuis]